MHDGELREALQRAGYIADEALATALWLAGELERPLLLEGDAGVGKTTLATAFAKARGRRLVRLQCYEGLDLAQAAYEWNYARQLLAIRLHETGGAARLSEADLFARDYLLERPLLQAITSDGPCVLLIDEIDRADEAFEAFLLEVLADYQITVPELGTLRARHVPQVVLTCNGTRDLSDALRRRCLYHWLDYPDPAREVAIVRATLPGAESALVEQAVDFVQRLRREDLAKKPGVAEALDWVRALHRIGLKALPDDLAPIEGTLACLLKTREDRFALDPVRLRQVREGRRGVGVAEKGSAAVKRTEARPLEAIAGFAQLLREHGLVVGIAEQQAMVRAALALPPERPERLDAAWRAIACHDARDWRRWPELFDRYWRPERQRGSTKISGQTRPSRQLCDVVQSLHDSMAPGSARGAPADAALQGAAAADDTGLQRAMGGASRTEALEDRSLSEWLPQDLALLDRLAERIAERLRRRLTRRWFDDDAGRRLDLRRTLRASLATGGLPLAPAWRQRGRERPRLFVLVDVSRSMQTHAQLFLRIARALVTAADARVFVFHTRLAEVTPLLVRDSATVQEKVNAVTAGFGGGTRIATSIADFRRVHVRQQLGRAARVWVLSDGFDADEPELLASELAAVRAKGARIEWIHPSADVPASAALAAVRARSGLVEGFHRLASLADLGRLADQLR